MLKDPTKSLDYKLIRELHEEVSILILSIQAVTIIQRKFREVRQRNEEDINVHGRFCDRKVQTDPVNPFKLGGMNDIDKFKKFFFAVYYTYMMMNTIMADALKK